MDKRSVTFSLAILVLMVSCVAPTPVPDAPGPPPSDLRERNSFGINLFESNIDWSDDRLFADLMKTARPWYKLGQWEVPGQEASVDSNFWPTEDAVLCLFDKSKPKMDGTYSISFTGSASAIIADWTGASIIDKAYNATTNTTSCKMVVSSPPTATNSAFLLQFEGTSGGVKDLKVMRPLVPGGTSSYAPDTLFTNEIRALISKFQVIRFVEYCEVNSSKLTTWAQRSLPTDASQQFRKIDGASAGGCYEYAIALCNQTNSDLWINIPLLADANYISEIANLVKSTLNSNQKVYVEYSNEVWNTDPAFQQTVQNAQRAATESGPGTALSYDGRTESALVAARRVGMKTVEISNTFRTIFGDSAMMTRIRPVLMGWAITDGPKDALMFIDQVYGKETIWCPTPKPVSYYVYAYGGGAYYFPDNYSDSLTLDSIWTSQFMNIDNWKPECRRQGSIAHAFGLKRIAYEGGMSLDNFGHSETVKALAYRDARTTTHMMSHIDDAWSANGGDMLLFFASTGGYSWGMTEDIFDLSTPKLQAIDQLNARYKAEATLGSVPPLTLTGDQFESSLYTTASAWASGTAYHVGANYYVVYPFRTTVAGTYRVSVSLNSNASTVSVIGDGLYLGSSTSSGTLPTYDMVIMSPGLHGIVIKTGSGEAEIKSIEIVPL